MNKLQEKIHNAACTIVNNMVDNEPREWPPACLFFAYQPMRPEVNSSEDTNSPEE